MNTWSLKVEDLCKRYGPVLALDRVSFEVEGGSSLALVGPNGAGKSSLLRILAGAARPDSGRIFGLRLCRCAYVPDGLVFPQTTSALDWLKFLARLKGAASRREARCQAERALERFGLAKVASAPVAGLSRGMQQRLLLAQASLGEPDLLLMDEPASALDPAWSAEWRAMIWGLRRRGATVLFSTHRLEDALELSDRVLLFRDGNLERDVTPEAWRSASEAEPFLPWTGRESVEVGISVPELAGKGSR